MKLTIERKQLLAALGIVKSVAADGRARTPLPVLSHVLINTFDKSVEFICTDLDVVVLRTRVDAEIKTKGATTVRASLLHDLARSFSGEFVELELAKDVLHVTCEKSKYQLGALPAGEFPPSPRLRDVFELEVEQGTLRSLLASTSFAAGRDESRVMLNSSLLRINGDLTAVGCDGKRLALFSASADGLGKKPRDLIVPTAAVNELLRLLDGEEEKTCRIVTAENLVQFHVGDTVLTSKLIEGSYLNFKQVVPATKGKGIPVGRVDLLGALQRCALISNVCQLDVRKQTLNIRAVGNGDLIGEASESLLIPPSDTLRAQCNARYLIEALSAIDDDEVQLFARPDEPIVVKVDGKPWVSVLVSYKDEEPKPQPQPVTKPTEAKPAEVKPATGDGDQAD